MQDIAKAQNQLNALGDIEINVDFDGFFTAKEIKCLPKILAEDEKIFGIIYGHSKINYDTETPCYYVCTDSRIICLSDKIIGGMTQFDLLYNQITGTSISKNIMTADLSITVANDKMKMQGVGISQGEAFLAKVNESMRESKKIKVELSASQTHFDVADQIEKLAKLKDRGLLTEEEFNQQKRKLLS